MPGINPEAAQHLVTQSGLVTGAQLNEAGVPRHVRRTLPHASSTLPELTLKSVFQLSEHPLCFDTALVALTLAHRDSFITGSTAGRVLGARRMPRASEIQLCIPHGRHVDVPVGVRLRQSRAIRADDVRTLDSGLRIATWPRLAFDLADELSASSLRSVIEQILQMRWATEVELHTIARRLCHPRRPGSGALLDALTAREGRRPVDSDVELLVLEGLLARGVPVVPQHSPARAQADRPARLDLAVPAARWAVEIDLHPSHGENDGAKDKRRDRSLHRRGWQIERVPPDDLRDIEALCDELAGLYFARLAHLAA